MRHFLKFKQQRRQVFNCLIFIINILVWVSINEAIAAVLVLYCSMLDVATTDFALLSTYI